MKKIVKLFIAVSLGFMMLSCVENTKKDLSPKGISAVKDGSRAGEVKKAGNIQFVWIPPGSFRMGSNTTRLYDAKPAHEVTLDGFWMGKYEVTQKQYEQIMGRNPSKGKSEGSNRPVEQVSWYDAVAFCKEFSNKYGVKARLPYEAEWEYACRAGSTTDYHWGDEVTGDYQWYYNNSGGTTRTVGTRKPNAWGLYDMAGNVFEWCMDWYDRNYYRKSPAMNPRGPAQGESRVIRSSSYRSESMMDSALRNGCLPGARDPEQGFRIILPSR